MTLPFSSPQLLHDASGRCFVSFYFNKRRFRFSSAKVLGLSIQPNKVPPEQRAVEAQRLVLAFHSALLDGWTPESVEEEVCDKERPVASFVEAFAPAPHLSKKYADELIGTRNRFLDFLSRRQLSQTPVSSLSRSQCVAFLNQCETASTFNHERQRLAAILKTAYSNLELNNPVHGIPQRKVAAVMHEPFEDVAAVLEEIRDFNSNLYLCCLITYGCLLRPHKEVRELSWQDIAPDLSSVKLSGKRNKSKRVRVVPIPDFVRDELRRRRERIKSTSENIFSMTVEPFNPSYFKSLWTVFKRKSSSVRKEQTLYSFRHTAALNLFSRSGDLRKLSTAMGHSSLEVTLGYLKHMARTELTAADMPML